MSFKDFGRKLFVTIRTLLCIGNSTKFMGQNYSIEERMQFGKRALQKSHDKIASLLKRWDYSKYGEPNASSISKYSSININSVYRHMKDFKVEIAEIKNNELAKRKEEEENRIMLMNQEALKNKVEENKPIEDEWGFLK